MRSSHAKKIIEIPLDVFETAESKDEIEDWLMAHDSRFVEKMRQAKREDSEGVWTSLNDFKKQLRIKS